MRLPIVPPLSTKDGTNNKNARLTNCLKESKKTGDKAVIRPGLVLDAQASGVGNGLVSFNGELVSVYGATLHIGGGAGLPIDEVVGLMPSAKYWSSAAYDGAGVICSVGYLDNTTEGTNAAVSDDNGVTWSENSGLPTSEYWSSIAYGVGKFVAVAYRTTNHTVAAYSADGVTWTASTLPTSAQWMDVASSGSNFCAISGSVASTAAATSNDGITWSASTLPASVAWQSIAWNGSHYCAIAFVSNQAAYSTDGSSWSSGTLPSVSGWSSIASDGNLFVAASSSQAKCAVSDDNGATWSAGTLPSGTSWEVIFDGSKFVAISTTSYSTSTDGFTWTTPVEFSGGASSLVPVKTTTGMLVIINNTDQSVRQLRGISNIDSLATITGTSFDFAQSPL